MSPGTERDREGKRWRKGKGMDRWIGADRIGKGKKWRRERDW